MVSFSFGSLHVMYSTNRIYEEVDDQRMELANSL